MPRHLALLRGINVSGHNIIKMDTLKTILENAGFTNVLTYIQTGNVWLSTPIAEAESVGFTIKQEIYKQLGLEVPVIVIAKTDLDSCLTQNPFLKEKDCDTKKWYVAFVSKKLQSQYALADLKMSQIKPDEVHIDGNKIFIKYAVGAGKTKLDQKYIEKKLGVIATIRNWNTVTQLHQLYEE